MKEKYTIPKLVKAERGWYVYYRYEGKQFRASMNFNKIKNLKQREAQYNELCQVMLIELKSGYNPNLPEGVHVMNDMYLLDALKFALEKKKDNISKKTYSGYSGTIRLIEDAAKKSKLNLLKIADTKRAHLKLLLENANSINDWSNKAHNKHLNHLKAVLSELIQWEIIEQNPAFNIKNLPQEETIANVPPTDKEMETIKKELAENHPHFLNYISLIYHLGIRPEEILLIQLSMIDMENDIIQLLPKNTKSRKKYRTLPINQYLKATLEKMNFGHLPKDYYLFGSFREPGKGNVGKHDDFIPGPTHLSRDTATRRWETVVKKKLNINRTMYSIKKYGGNKKSAAGISLDAIKGVFGHSDKETTLIYLTNQDEINRQEVLKKSPDF